MLEHDDGCPEQRLVGQELEGEGGGYLVWDVGHAQVEVGQLGLQDVCLDDLMAGKLSACLGGALAVCQ